MVQPYCYVCLWQKTCSQCHIMTHTELLWSHRSECVCVLNMMGGQRLIKSQHTLAEVSVCVWFVGEASQSTERLHWDAHMNRERLVCFSFRRRARALHWVWISKFLLQDQSSESSFSLMLFQTHAGIYIHENYFWRIFCTFLSLKQQIKMYAFNACKASAKCIKGNVFFGWTILLKERERK